MENLLACLPRYFHMKVVETEKNILVSHKVFLTALKTFLQHFGFPSLSLSFFHGLDILKFLDNAEEDQRVQQPNHCDNNKHEHIKLNVNNIMCCLIDEYPKMHFH